MNISNLFRIALRAIGANKLRSFLTMLGIIIGVASVIAMLAIGQGSKQSIQSSISSMGSNMLTIRPGQDRGPGGSAQSADAMQTLKLKDYETLKQDASLLSHITPNVSTSGQFIYGNSNTPSQLQGVAPDYLQIRQLKIEDGEMFTSDDVRTNAKVCVVGKTVVDNLFPNGEDPVGKVIRFNTTPFRIVGVLKEKGYSTFGQDQDDIVLAPYTSVMKRIMSITYLQSIIASAKSEEQSEEAMAQVTALLRENHKLKGADADDFSIRSQKELASMMNSTADTMTTLLLCVACISLIVGGIGIMNIMYVSVTERTREIGLRMSVGARGRDILSQFLIEAVMLSIVGGLIGVIIGIGSAYAINVFAAWPIQIQPWSVFLSFGVCTITGVFFGWYPAKKAANLDPIEAIRYE